MARRVRRLSLSLLLLISVGAGALMAQVGTATLSGVVTDASGSSVPNAEVSLESELQKYSRRARTGVSGEYVIPAIPPGTYRLTVQAQGFTNETRTDIPLSSGQSSTLNVVLNVAGATQQVTVVEAPPLLQTTTATVGTAVETKQLNELPTLGRNFTNLILIAPGVTPLGPPDSTNLSATQTAINPSVYGQRQRDNNFTLDGVGNNEPLFNAIPISPPPEAIAEMKIESGMSSGAYGHASGANINVVTKSGTNALHGDAWESFRNTSLDAKSFFSPRVSPYRWNQFGAAVGGPLVVPKLLSKDKGWYFFGYYEGLRVRRSADIIQLVPTPAELSGNFAGDPVIYNPYTTTTGPDGKQTRQPFPNNQIPANLLNPAAVTIAKALYPSPNLAPNVIPGRNFLTSAPSLQDGDQWSGRVDHQFGAKDSFFVRYTDGRNPTRSFSLPALPSEGVVRTTNIAVSHTHTFSPTFLITGRFGLTRINSQNQTIGDQQLARKAGTLEGFPAIDGREVIPPILIPNYPQLSQGFGYYGPQYVLSWIGDAHKITGRHTFEFGGAILHTQFKTNNQTGTQVSFTRTQTSDFVSPDSGFGLASFMLGTPESAGRVIGSTEGDMHGNNYSLYVQDNFRATSKLTLNIGLRYDYSSPMLNNHGSGTYIWELGKYVWDITNPITNEPANIRRGGIDPDRNNFQPRVGIAYQLNDKTVVRTSYGIFFDSFGVNYAQTQQGNRGNWPFAFPQTVSNLNTGIPNAFLQNPFPGQASGSRTPLGCQQCLNVWKSTSRTPYVQEWTFSLQRTLTPSLMTEAAYFGSHGLKLGGQIVDNTAMVPGPGPISARQAHPDFPLYVNNGFNAFPSFYDALSLKLEKRFSKGLSFAANYTWAKNLDYVDSLVNQGYPFASPTRFNYQRLKGPAGFDLTHRFVLSYIYEIPGKTSNRAVNAVVSNWAVAGIISFDNGFPISPLLSSDNENIGSIPGRLTAFPNLVGDPNQIEKRTPQRWFNTAAFAVPAPFTAGNAGRNIMRADGLKNWDFSIYKQFPFTEARRIELRGEFFNLVNNTTFGTPVYLADTPQFGQVSSARKSGRQVQLSLRLHF